MSREQRRFEHERQPLLPLNETAREINRRDQRQEVQKPEQLKLFAPDQKDLFPQTG